MLTYISTVYALKYCTKQRVQSDNTTKPKQCALLNNMGRTTKTKGALHPGGCSPARVITSLYLTKDSQRELKHYITEKAIIIT